MSAIDWIVLETTETGFNPTQLHHKETVFSLSNGYLGTRGTFEEGYPGSCPATLINGVYDDAPIVATELANCPDWLSLELIFEGDRFRLDQGEILSYQRQLNLYQGILSRNLRWRSPKGHTLDLYFERFVSLADEHVLALRCQILPVDFSGRVEVQASLNGYPDNEGLRHWNCQNQSNGESPIWLHLQTRRSKLDLGMAAQLTIGGVETSVQSLGFQGAPTFMAQFDTKPGDRIVIDKVVTLFTSRDTSTPVIAALNKLALLPDYTILREAHQQTWAGVWQTSDIVIEGDSAAQLAVRYNLFQLLGATPRHSDRVSIPAKTLTGFAYRGHVFWDTEIFILPCLTFSHPDLARNLLTYRYHTLEGARRKAQANGLEGAMYVWESADTGDEVTPSWVPAPQGKELIRIWCGDIELHISADVAYAVWQYWQVTTDHDWMAAYGAEIVLDTAVFWGSRAEWNANQNRYEIQDVIGPDEYHERVNNSAFTNAMAQWNLQKALTVWSWLQQYDPHKAEELKTKLGLTRDRLAHWQDVVTKVWIAQDPQTGLIEQFEGFFELEDINLQDYEPRTRSMQALLGIEGANQRQVLKQADVLMLLYLLRQAAFVQPTLVNCDRATLQANWNYYEPRTDHTYGSSLSPAIHAILACELGDPEAAYEHFMRAALVDLADVRGNAGEGIHAASLGGVWQAIVFGFGGVQLTESGPVAMPQLPPGWTRLKFQLVWQGQHYHFDLRSAVPTPEPRWLTAPIKGFIFDLDGVLTDTSEFHYQAWQRLADEAGLPFDRHANEALRGVSRRDSLLLILGDRTVPESEFQAMMTRKNDYYLELIRTITPANLLPGARELLLELRQAGIKIALGSASKNAPEVLERLGIDHLMDAIADGNSVAHSKPAPDVFLHAAAQLGLDPATCVVVEDAAAGLEAALRAGMWTIGLGPRDRVDAAHIILPNLVGAHWADLGNQLHSVTRLAQTRLAVQQLTQLQQV